jgi:diadenosine tetraphosphatase ApaH/serine/threonine PP2A family protein phosphatase
MVLAHGAGPPGPERNPLPDSTDERLESMLPEGGSDAPFVLFGHSHVQFRRTINGREYINPGSVGQNRTGKQIACYGVFLDGKFEHRQVPFDVVPVVEAYGRCLELDDVEGGTEFREWLKDGVVTGFGLGKSEPWITFADQGYD